MNPVTFEVKSWLRMRLDLAEFPELSSPRRFIQKGIDILRQRTPRVLAYLSRQQVTANLHRHRIFIRSRRKTTDRRVRRIFKRWIRKERSKRLACLVGEGILLPFSGILAILPGPNFFFYVLALLFYYHLAAYRGLGRIDGDTTEITVVYGGKGKDGGANSEKGGDRIRTDE